MHSRIITILVKTCTSEFWIGSQICCLLRLTTTSRDYTLIVISISKNILEHIRSSQSVKIVTSRCSIAARNGGLSHFSGYPNCRRPQLPTSNSNKSTDPLRIGQLVKLQLPSPAQSFVDSVSSRSTTKIFILS